MAEPTVSIECSVGVPPSDAGPPIAVPFAPPHMKAKPQMKKPIIPMPYTMKFIDMVCAAFLARMRPVSTSAKPACMNMTRNPATSVQTKLTE